MTKYKKQVQVSIPESFDLGFCPVNKVSEFPFTIHNPNSKPVNYIFKFTQFLISPSKGVLMPNSLCNFKIEFKPTQATVLVGTVILEIEGESQRVFKLSAIGKYPYLSVSVSEIDFGNVLVTKPVAKDIVIKNNSEVPAEFSIVQPMVQHDYNDTFYSFSPEKGVLPPKMSYNLKVTYCPSFVDNSTINNFKMICSSGNQVDLYLKGYSKRFNVAFSSSSLNFGEIKLDTTLNKVLTVTNSSEMETDFEFYTDPSNIFSFNEIKGSIAKNSYKKIIIEFRPRNTIAYYERVYCLVRNHLLLYVDLIGTCYDLLIKPIPLLQTHIDTWRKRVIEGRISEVELKYIENNLQMKLNRNREDDDMEEENFYQTKMSIIEKNYIMQKELLLEGYKNELLAVSQDNIEFGFCEIMTLSGQREIEITNRLHCKLTLFWIPQKKETLNGEYMTVFQVYPETITLKPNVPTRFQITFRPLKSNTYYFQHLQFYAIKQNSKISKKTLQEYEYKEFKSKPEATLLRNVKLSHTIQSKVREDVESVEVLPPIARVVRCVGHSFSPSTLPFLPIMKIKPSNVVRFKPCSKDYSVYESVELLNHSDTPIFFKFGAEITKAFRVYPKMGLIEPKSFCIVMVEFTPREYKTYQSSINIHLNDMPAATSKLSFVGICSSPELSLENKGVIYFPPTYQGVYTKKKINVQNMSKSKVNYTITIPEKYKEEVYFEPAEKMLQANEIAIVNVFFAPQAKRNYNFKVPIEASEEPSEFDLNVGYHVPGSAVLAINGERSKPQTKCFEFEIHGEGADGTLQLSQKLLDFDSVKVTQQKKLAFKIKNTSDCAFYVDISLKNNKFEGEKVPSETQITNMFSFDFKEGKIPANSEIDVGLFFTPTEVMEFDLKLIVCTKERVPSKTGTLRAKGFESCQKCQLEVKAQGNYPLLEIIDIRNDTLSVAALWENFQIERINNELSCKLDTEEKKYLNIQNYTFKEQKMLEHQLKNYEWNLGYVSTKNRARPRKVIITVRNSGGTPLDYQFKFPSDNKVQEELWADSGEPTEEEAYEKAILDKNIFKIKPKVGHLNPNEVKDIELIYSPVALDKNKLSTTNNEMHLLKVVFQIASGKSLVFNLKGTTLGPSQGLLTVKKNKFVLPLAPIGLLSPLRFPIEVNNVGSIKVTYKTEIEYEEGQFQEVFKIENPSHFLLPGQNHYIYCLYKPLIEKQYKFKIFLHVFDFSKLIQKIELRLEGEAKTRIKQNTDQMSIVKSTPGQRNLVSEMGSKVFFSIEAIDFGVMRSDSTEYRMIILYNMSQKHSLNFDFLTQSLTNTKFGLTCGDKLAIEPNNGNLEPGNFIELKITLTSTGSFSIYEGEIPCQITWAQNIYSTQENDITQKDLNLAPQKESLFLRIKKVSFLNDKRPKENPYKKESTVRKSLVDSIFESIINSTLNESALERTIEELEREQQPLLDMMCQYEPAAIGEQIKLKEEDVEDKKDFSNHENTIICDQFKDVTEIILENTFFNVIQETTHKQNDFLRLGKKFIPADRL